MSRFSPRDWLPSGKTLAVVPPFAWLLVFLLVPFLLVFKISFAELQFGVPPHAAGRIQDEAVQFSLHLRGYILLLTDSLYFATYLNSVKIAAITTLCCVLIGYPIAYYIARSSPSVRNLLLLGVILPFWTSLLLRVYAWVGILRNDGLLNNLLQALGIISSPLEIYRTDLAVYIGMVYAYLPFFILPLYATLVKMDLRLLEAAYDLGAKPWQAFWQITVPLSRQGVIAGAMLVFIPAVGEYVIPEMLGGANTLMMGRVMWNEFFNNTDWPMASAVTCVMVLLLLVPLALFQYNQVKQQEQAGGGANERSQQDAARPRARAGVFLPVCAHRQPDGLLVQRVAGGHVLDWLLDALVPLAVQRRRAAARGLSFRIAALTATAAVILGTWAGYVLARMGRFRGFTLYVGMLSAPLVIPEVVLGISLLLMFVELRGHLGWPAENGMFTIWVGHVTLCMAFVAVVIQTRIRDLDRSLEEAALDLGATPLVVFFKITLPLIAPALASAWLLSFTLSLDDVVLASFLSGPSSSTLPMEVFSRVRLGLKPEINALATLFILAVGTCVILANRLQSRKETEFK